jgi:hypothetical protein
MKVGERFAIIAPRFFFGGENMRRIRIIHAALLLLGWSFSFDKALAQTAPQPQILYVMPPGGQAGTTVDISVTGQNISGAEGLHFNFPGVKVEGLGSGSNPEFDPKSKKQPKPPPGLTTQRFKVTLPAKAPLGIQDIRVVTKGGISNPRAFVVSDTKEFVEKEPNNDVPEANKVELNSAVSGVITNPTDVDFFLFSGKKGQKVVVSCLTTSIDSKLPAEIQLYSKGGSYLGGNKNYQGGNLNNDALLDAVLPDDGDYYVRVSSFTYTLAGPDYFYRLTISTAPWIDAIHPSAIEPGKEAAVTVYGRNLPGGKPDPETKVGGRVLEKVTMKVKAPNEARSTQRRGAGSHAAPQQGFLDGFDFHLKNEAGQSNPYVIHFATAPVVLDNEKNDTRNTAQKVTVPCLIAGRFEKKADEDWYAFTAKKGDVFTIEAYGDRLGSAVDLKFRLIDSQANIIVERDDNPETAALHFFNRTEDPPSYRFVAKADGEYLLQVSSQYSFVDAGPRHLYHVRITSEQPDFRLVAMPTSNVAPEGVVVGQGGHQAYTVFVHRQDGFNSDITISGDKLPPGLTVAPQVISAGTKLTAVVVSASAQAEPWAGGITLIGTATINGKKVEREVRGATISWAVQQPAPTLTRMDRELTLAIRDKAPFSLTIEKDKITVNQGERITIPVKLTRLQPNFNATVNVTALALPPGYAMQPVAFAPGKDTGTVNIDAKPMASPGVYSLVLRGQTGPVGPKPPPKPVPGAISLPSTPVSLIVVPKQLAKLKVPNNVSKLQVGKDAELNVDVARLFDYDGPFKLELVVPPTVKGISAMESQLKAGDTSGKLVIRAGPDAKIGAAPQLTVRLTAMFNGTTPVVHEAKVTVNVTK